MIKADHSLFVECDGRLVENERATTRGTSEHEGFFCGGIGCIDFACNILGSPLREGCVVRLNNYAHGIDSVILGESGEEQLLPRIYFRDVKVCLERQVHCFTTVSD